MPAFAVPTTKSQTPKADKNEAPSVGPVASDKLAASNASTQIQQCSDPKRDAGNKAAVSVRNINTGKQNQSNQSVKAVEAPQKKTQLNATPVPDAKALTAQDAAKEHLPHVVKQANSSNSTVTDSITTAELMRRASTNRVRLPAGKPITRGSSAHEVMPDASSAHHSTEKRSMKYKPQPLTPPPGMSHRGSANKISELVPDQSSIPLKRNSDTSEMGESPTRSRSSATGEGSVQATPPQISEDAAKLQSAISELSQKLDTQQKHWSTRLALAENEYEALAELRIKEQERHFAQVQRASAERTKAFEAYKDSVLLQLRDASAKREEDIRQAVDAARAAHKAAADALAATSQQTESRLESLRLLHQRADSVAGNTSAIQENKSAPTSPAQLQTTTSQNLDTKSTSSKSSTDSDDMDEALESLAAYAQQVEGMIAALSPGAQQRYNEATVYNQSPSQHPTGGIYFQEGATTFRQPFMTVFGRTPANSAGPTVSNAGPSNTPPPPPHYISSGQAAVHFREDAISRLPTALYPPNYYNLQQGPNVSQFHLHGAYSSASPDASLQLPVPTVQTLMKLQPATFSPQTSAASSPAIRPDVFVRALESTLSMPPPPPPADAMLGAFDEHLAHDEPTEHAPAKHDTTTVVQPYPELAPTERGRSSRLEMPTVTSLGRLAESHRAIADRLSVEEQRDAMANSKGLDNAFFARKHLRPPSESAARVEFAKKLYADLNRHSARSSPKQRALARSPPKMHVSTTGQHMSQPSSPLKDVARHLSQLN